MRLLFKTGAAIALAVALGACSLGGLLGGVFHGTLVKSKKSIMLEAAASRAVNGFRLKRFSTKASHDVESVITCDNIVTMPRSDVGRLIGFLLPEQEQALTSAIMAAFDLEPA